ncbi:MAG: hypothetical protein M3R13_02980 [Armatimonadota bacterium]|nr:hypothetical protein [Armatimonadota bacterium]
MQPFGRPVPHLNRHVRTNRFSVAIGCAFIGLVLTVADSLLRNIDFDLLLILMMVVSMFVVGLIAAPFIDDIIPIRMYEGVLRTYTSLSTTVAVGWEKMRKVSTLTIAPGLSYLVLNDGRPYLLRGLIPLFISNRSEFYEDLVNVVGEDHIVTKALKARGFDW